MALRISCLNLLVYIIIIRKLQLCKQGVSKSWIGLIYCPSYDISLTTLLEWPSTKVGWTSLLPSPRERTRLKCCSSQEWDTSFVFCIFELFSRVNQAITENVLRKFTLLFYLYHCYVPIFFYGYCGNCDNKVQLTLNIVFLKGLIICFAFIFKYWISE